MESITKIGRVTVDNGVEVFYREAGAPSHPVILLLHGFPSSSHQFRNLIPVLASKYHVLAPDLPGYGFTTVPTERTYEYTFASLTTTMEKFLDALHVAHFAVYIFDYGAPVAFRLALARPTAIAAIVTQNGNAYEEGLGREFWAPLQSYWKSDSQEDRDKLKVALTLETTKWQYVAGRSDPENVPPEAYWLDYALMGRPGNDEVQLDLFRDYKNNVALYPKFQEYLRTSKVPVLAAWGLNDAIFVKEGAEALKRDVEDLELCWIEAGHFAIEGNEDTMGAWILGFLDRIGFAKSRGTMVEEKPH